MVRIERLGPQGWERVRAVRLRALMDAPDAFWATAHEEAAMTEAHWRERLSRPDTVTFVASRSGEDAGLVVGAPHHAHNGDAGLYAMWVAPEHRGAGVAVALIETVLAWARAGGFRRLRLEVADTNMVAVRLYERMGFEPTGASGHMPPPRQHITEHERARDVTAG